MTMNETSQATALKSLSGPILVPLDGTDVAEGILPWASRIAKVANTPLILLTVADPDGLEYPSWLSPFSQTATRDDWTVFWPRLRKTRESMPWTP